MKKSDVIETIFSSTVQLAMEHHGEGMEHEDSLLFSLPKREKGLAYAPTNIALCKYWGKRDTEINLPMTSSLSIALPDKGAMTALSLSTTGSDIVILNGDELGPDSGFVTRVSEFLDLFRIGHKWQLKIDINMNIPVAAGLASSACGFASIVAAMNDMFDWKLSLPHLSILARLGSGSAARSFWNGFVEWHAGTNSDGMDCYAEPLDYTWNDLCVGILSVNHEEKAISSRDAMLRTVNSSALYPSWPKKVAQDLAILKHAIKSRNFALMAGTSESNALAMHATMLSSWPPVCYFQPDTIAAMHKIWKLRAEGLNVFFTQDAGPNLKLLFVDKDKNSVKQHFPDVEIIKVFE